MATAGTVTIKLDGDSATLIRELNKANQASKSTFGEIKREAAQVAAKFAVIATAAAGAFVALTKASFESIDQLAKVSDRLGVSTEAMRTLQVAADLAGVSQDMLTKSLQKQQKALVDAADGAGTSGQAFARLGLNAQALINMPVDQQFATIAEALAGVDNVARRNALAFEIWGSKAGEMINLAMGGTAGMEELKQLLEDLNVTVSRFDASKIEQANDAVSLAKLAFQGLGNTIAIAVAPYVTALANDFTDAGRSSGGFAKEVDSAMRFAANAAGFVGDAVLGLKIIFKGAAAVILQVGSVIIEAFAGMGGAINLVLIQPILNGLAKITGAAAVMADAVGLDSLAASAKSAQDSLRGMASAVSDGLVGAREVAANMRGAAGDLADEISDALNQQLPSEAIDEWFAKAKKAADEAAAKMQNAPDPKGGNDGAGAGAFKNTYAQTLVAPKIDVPKIDMPTMPYLDPEFVRGAADLSAQQYLEAWQLANEQRLVAENELRSTLFASDEEAGVALIELAAAQARQKVIAEFEARGQAVSETGETADPAQQAEFELAVKEQMLSSEADLLNRRLAMQQQFGGQYLNLQKSIATLMGKTWADGHKKTLANMAGFAGSAMSITQSLFGQNKKVAIAMAVIDTLRMAVRAGADTPGPWPIKAAAIAAALASGYAQVSSIKSTNIGGGGGVGGVGGGLGGAPTSQPISNATNNEQENRRSAIQVVFQGDVVGWDDFMRDRFVSSLRDLVDGNDVILFGSNSRQAAEIRGG